MKNLSVAAHFDVHKRNTRLYSLYVSCIYVCWHRRGRWKSVRSPAQRALLPLFFPGNTMAAALYELSGEMHCRKVTHMKITQGEVGRECI